MKKSIKPPNKALSIDEAGEDPEYCHFYQWMNPPTNDKNPKKNMKKVILVLLLLIIIKSNAFSQKYYSFEINSYQETYLGNPITVSKLPGTPAIIHITQGFTYIVTETSTSKSVLTVESKNVEETEEDYIVDGQAIDFNGDAYYWVFVYNKANNSYVFSFMGLDLTGSLFILSPYINTYELP